MEGFEKIDLHANVKVGKLSENKQPESPDPKENMPKKKIKLLLQGSLGLIVVLILFGLFVVFGIIVPAGKLYVKARATAVGAKDILTAMKQQNIELAGQKIADTKKSLTDTQKDLKGLGYLTFVPIAGWYYQDATHLLNAGSAGLDAGSTLVDALVPYADVLGLKGAHSFVGGSAQERIKTAVTTMSKITPKIDDIESSLVKVKAEIDQVQPWHYPALFGGKAIKNNLTTARTLTDEAVTFITQAKPLVKVLPLELGDPIEKKYLVLFQNDKELRPTGGFITAYAIFSVDHGVIRVDKSDDIYHLDATIGNKPVAPRAILNYLPKVPLWNLRDTNLSPDFVTSMKDFNNLYVKAGQYEKVDGIIAVDTYPLVAAMNILGDIQAAGQTFTTKIDQRCNCPQVIYQMEATADQPVGYIKENRKSFIGELMYAIMQKAFSSSPKLYWGPLFQTMITMTSQKHILFYVYNTDAQSGLEALNASGRIQNFDGDYLHINEANFGGAKSELFITETVRQNYQVQGDGSMQKTITINYKNPFAPSDCNLEHGGLCLNAVLRDYIRVYVPKGSTLVDSKGSEVKVTSYDELGKTVFEGFLTVRPLGTATYTLTYKLPFALAKNSPLPLMIQKQPGTNGNQYTIAINDKDMQQFPLLTDIITKLNIK